MRHSTSVHIITVNIGYINWYHFRGKAAMLQMFSVWGKFPVAHSPPAAFLPTTPVCCWPDQYHHLYLYQCHLHGLWCYNRWASTGGATPGQDMSCVPGCIWQQRWTGDAPHSLPRHRAAPLPLLRTEVCAEKEPGRSPRASPGLQGADLPGVRQEVHQEERVCRSRARTHG